MKRLELRWSKLRFVNSFGSGDAQKFPILVEKSHGIKLPGSKRVF